jgi:predicted RNA polymerase sigma factor
VSATDPHQVFHRTIEAVWRIESARVIADLTRLTRLTRDLDLAEDLAQEALVAALEQWPQSGVPDNLCGMAHRNRQTPRRARIVRGLRVRG